MSSNKLPIFYKKEKQLACKDISTRKFENIKTTRNKWKRESVQPKIKAEV